MRRTEKSNGPIPLFDDWTTLKVASAEHLRRCRELQERLEAAEKERLDLLPAATSPEARAVLRVIDGGRTHLVTP